MDTKSRNVKPFYAWLAFFLAVNIIVIILMTGLAALAHPNGNTLTLKDPFIDYRDTMAFKERTGNYFTNLMDVIATSPPVGNEEEATSLEQRISSTQQWLNEEGNNLLYYAVNQSNGRVVKNNEDISFGTTSGLPMLPSEYSYYWYFDGQQVRVFNDGKPVDVNRLDSGYRSLMNRLQNQSSSIQKIGAIQVEIQSSSYSPVDSTSSVPTIVPETGNDQDLSKVRVVVAVNKDLQPNPYGRSMYYWEQQFLSILGWIYIAAGGLFLALLAYAVYRRGDKRAFDRWLARLSGRLWLEAKIVLSLIAFACLIAMPGAVYWRGYYWNSDLPGNLLGIVLVSCAILLAGWWFYLMLIDLIHNRRQFFGNNVINSVLIRYREYEGRYPWQQAMLKRVYLLVAVEAVLAFFAVVFLLVTAGGNDAMWFLLALMLTAAGIYLLYRYLKQYGQMVADLGRLVDQIARIKNGELTAPLELEKDADMHEAAQNLNSIQEGMSIAIEERIKSERMKVELITNVSHDLKTPLTSIISYVDLLTKEEGLPEHVNDYIQILAQKGDRLQHLIQDLFDLSKASSNNIALDLEPLDLTRLINQTLADMEEQITASGLAFRTNLPDGPVNIFSDGKKLYRVLENLITNTLKYSLAGSRVYLTLAVDRQRAVVTIKNTANYEMDFTEEEILERFVRGDKARSNEGSGLGLSIAQSFTQICGGKFVVKIDGDLFKVELHFPTV